MRRTILFVGGGIETLPGVRVAQEMGLRVAVSDRNACAPCMQAADYSILADTYDLEGTADAVAEHWRLRGPIQGVLCLATDVPMTVARVAARFGLPGISQETAAIASDKLRMKQIFDREGIPTPPHRVITSLDELKQGIQALGLPAILKPTDNRGGRGVLRLDASMDLAWAFDYTRGFTAKPHLLLERCMTGPQISSESMVIHRNAITVALSDRNYSRLNQFAPHIIEDGGELPSLQGAALASSIAELIQRVARAMGMQNGTLKGDLVVEGGRPWVIEVAARLSGGLFCSHEIPLHCGVSMVELAIQQALGEPVPIRALKHRWCTHVAQRYLFPAPGRVISVTGQQAALAKPGIAFCQVRVKPGDVISDYACHPQRAGLVIATGDGRDQAIARAQDAVRTLQIHTCP